MWWLLFLLHIAHADDDQWLPDIPETIPTMTLEQSSRQAFPWAIGNLATIADMQDGAGAYQYNFVRDSDIVESLFETCYEKGYGPPIQYPYAYDIWDRMNYRLRGIEAGTIWCSIPDEKFEVRQLKLPWYEVRHITYPDRIRDLLKQRMEKFNDKPDIHDSKSHVTDPFVEYEVNLGDHTAKRYMVNFPFNIESARDQASRMAKKAAGLYMTESATVSNSMFDFCQLYNIVSTGGYEFEEVPEFSHDESLTFPTMVLQTQGKFEFQLNISNGWQNITSDNVASMWDDTIESLGGPYGWRMVRFSNRFLCEDYGFESISKADCEKDTFQQMIELNPQMLSNGENLCRDNGEDVYIYHNNVSDIPRQDNLENDVSNIIKVRAVGSADWKHPIVLTHDGNGVASGVPNTKLMCKIDHQLNPVQADYGSAMNYKYLLEQTHNAHMAVMTWAHVNCKDSWGVDFSSDAGFSCLLGINDIKMTGAAFTIPLPFGFQIGWNFKTIKKAGLSFIVKNKFSFCTVTSEKAKMQGPKVSWSPVKTEVSLAEAKDMLKNKQNGFKNLKEACRARSKSQMLTIKNLKKNSRGGWGTSRKWLQAQVGREGSNAAATSIQAHTGLRTRYEVEWWMEEGTCDDSSDCKLKTDTYSWSMVAATASFFSASARASYIRVWLTPDMDENLADAYLTFMKVSQLLPFGPIAEFISHSLSSGWDRYLVQLKARVQIIPNIAQVANVAYGRPKTTVATKGSQSDWNKAAKTDSGKKKKFNWKAIMGELIFSLEKGFGNGELSILARNGNRLSSGSWDELHNPYQGYWGELRERELHASQPRTPFVECTDNPISLFKVTSCSDQNEHDDYMPVYAPTRESQIFIPISHYRDYSRIYNHDTKHLKKKERSTMKKIQPLCNLPDISFSDTEKMNRHKRFTHGQSIILHRSKINYLTTFTGFGNNYATDAAKLSNSYLYGMQDNLQENNVTHNYLAVTSADEATGKLEVHTPTFQIINQDSCEAFGLTSIFAMTHPFNAFVGEHIVNNLVVENRNDWATEDTKNKWKDEVLKKSFVEITVNEDGDRDETSIDDIHASPIRPYGLIITDKRDNGEERQLRQTGRYFYGQRALTSGSLTKHYGCRDDYQCICLPPSTYTYVKYSTLANDKANRKDLIIHPVDSYQECKIASANHYDDISDDIFKSVEYYMNTVYTGDGVELIRKRTMPGGCLIHGGKWKFNDHKRALGIRTQSVVKLLKLDREITDTYVYANSGDNDYQRFISRKKSVQDSVTTALGSTISLVPQPGYGFNQVQKVFQNGVVGYFAIEPTYQALKDDQAVHVVVDNKLFTWRFVNQYLKLNKGIVEKYSLDGDVPVVSYLDMSRKKHNTWVSSSEPEGKRINSFVKNLGSYTASASDVTVPDVDFIDENKKIAFHGRNIPMGENTCIAPCGIEQSLDAIANSKSCVGSLMLPNRCPSGYGMDGDIVVNSDKDEHEVPFIRGTKRQCALCPMVATCHTLCKCYDGTCSDRYTGVCLECLSPKGRYRCQQDLSQCDKPGFVWVTTSRGGRTGRLSGHCVKTDIDPKEEDEWHTTNLQKKYWNENTPFFPHRWQDSWDISFIRNEPSHTRYLTCESGYVPVRQSDSNTGTGTCSGYVCERCPPTYIEDRQICKKCGERQVAGHLLGAGYNENMCYQVPVPLGHYFDSQNSDGVSQNNIVRCSDPDSEITEQPVCESNGHTWFDSTPINGKFPFVTHCDHWFNHPAGSFGAYQDETNQLFCKTTNSTSNNFGEHATIFPMSSIVKFWSKPGVRVNAARTAQVDCKEHQVCNGEEITGCKPGWIWKKQTINRDDEECFPCNQETVDHTEKDNYEYCDGSHKFRCADASYTNGYDTYDFELKKHDDNLFVGVRTEWDSSRLIVPKTRKWIENEDKDNEITFEKLFSWKSFTTWNKIPTESDLADFISFKQKHWVYSVGNDHQANWESYERAKSIGIEKYTYSSSFKLDDRRTVANEPFNNGAKCFPVPDEFYALPNEWKKKDCGFSKSLCKHRTFHEIIPFKPICTDADRYFLSSAVREECYDYIYRWEDRMCTDGLLPGGCHKEYCSREGQSNCWCGDEEDFCTMGCVDGMCQEICGDRVCKHYELCYGEFNAITNFAQCVIECTEPKSNYCLWENNDGNTVYCRHFNSNYDKPPLDQLKNESPCFDEVPSIPENQCKSVFETECFCGRTLIKANDARPCVNGQLRTLCSILQDDGTCTYENDPDAVCLCGDTLISTSTGQQCYAVDGDCGIKGSDKQNCAMLIENKQHVPLINGCRPNGDEENINKCLKAKSITKVYTQISDAPKITCNGNIDSELAGCIDPQGLNHNSMATLPKKCEY